MLPLSILVSLSQPESILADTLTPSLILCRATSRFGRDTAERAAGSSIALAANNVHDPALRMQPRGRENFRPLSEEATRWEAEFCDRDDPVLLRIERRNDRLIFLSAKGELRATATGEKAGRTMFRLDPNELLGEVTGEIDARGAGVVHTKEGDIPLRGRAVATFPAWVAPEPEGRGFPKLELARRMRDAATSALSVARIEDDRVVEEGVYGVSPSALFQAGTMSEPVLKVIVLRLAAAGKIDLDRKANSYLGEERIPTGSRGWGAFVTVRDLMRGTSGFAFSKSAGFAPDVVIPSLRDFLGTTEPTRKPGTAENVSATDGAFLERIIVRVTGRPAAEIAQREVFGPLQMRDSTYAAFPAGAAGGHYSSGEPTFDSHHVYPDALVNGLWTSGRDSSRFVAEVGKLLGGRPNAILPETKRPLLARVDASKSMLGIRKDEGGRMYLGGDPYGYFCEFFLDPSRGTGVVILQNRMMGWRLANEIRDLILTPSKG